MKITAGMKRKEETKGRESGGSLNMRNIFMYMMEEGHYPQFEKTHILFGIDDNTGVVEYQEGILLIRVFFTIDEEAYNLFLEASNSTMAETFTVKPAILDDAKTIMFSCEIICDNMHDLRRFFPRGVARLKEALEVHKAEMKKIIMSESLSSTAFAASGDSFGLNSKTAKPLS